MIWASLNEKGLITCCPLERRRSFTQTVSTLTVVTHVKPFPLLLDETPCCPAAVTEVESGSALLSPHTTSRCDCWKIRSLKCMTWYLREKIQNIFVLQIKYKLNSLTTGLLLAPLSLSFHTNAIKIHIELWKYKSPTFWTLLSAQFGHNFSGNNTVF